MATVRVERMIEADPDAVWAVITDPTAILDWFTGVASARMTDEGREVTIESGETVVEEIVTNDSELRRFQYSVLRGDFPMEFHLSTIDVHDINGSAFVVYALDIKPDEYGPAFTPNINAGMDGLVAHFAK